MLFLCVMESWYTGWNTRKPGWGYWNKVTKDWCNVSQGTVAEQLLHTWPGVFLMG